jgi:uncharacterized phage-associated protein
MFPVTALAKCLLRRAQLSEGDLLTPLKLQKLLYYLQGRHLVVFGRVAFKEKIEAWAMGPVVRSIYEKFASRNDGLRPEEIVDDTELPPEVEAMCQGLIEEFRSVSPGALIDWPHQESPWELTRQQFGAKEGQSCCGEISIEEIRRYFSQYKFFREYAFAKSGSGKELRRWWTLASFLV